MLLACGSGLLKPNVSTLVGNLYRDRPELRDQGFNIYYMGINLGAFISPLTVAWLRNALRLERRLHVGGGRDAALAVTFVGFKHHLAEAAVKVERAVGGAPALPPGDARSRVITLMAIFGISLVFWIAFYQIF